MCSCVFNIRLFMSPFQSQLCVSKTLKLVLKQTKNLFSILSEINTIILILKKFNIFIHTLWNIKPYKKCSYNYF